MDKLILAETKDSEQLMQFLFKEWDYERDNIVSTPNLSFWKNQFDKYNDDDILCLYKLEKDEIRGCVFYHKLHKTIYNFLVKKEYRSNGIGTKLVEEMLKLIESKTNDNFLYVILMNNDHLAFWKRNGFLDLGKKERNRKVLEKLIL